MRNALRPIIGTLLLILMTLPLPASSPAAGRVVGAFLTSDLPRYREAHQQFMKTFSARGLSASYEIILQTPNPDPLSWSNAARKFAAYRPELIIAYGAPAVAAALRETEGIPVIAADAVLPESIQNQPELCGISSKVPMVTLVKQLNEMKPLKRLGVLYNAKEAGSLKQLEELRKAARQFNIPLHEANITASSALESGLTQLIEKSDAIMVTESSVVCRSFDRIIQKARAAKMPVASTMPDSAERGALISLETSTTEQGQTAAQLAIRVLEGTRPSQIGIVSPRRIDLVINMKAARELEINIPFQVLGAATRILR